MLRAIVTDIEGTTTPVSFVTDILFPYARTRLPDFIRFRFARPEMAEIVQQVRHLSGDAGAGAEDIIAILLGWMDEDRKAPPLKELQGLIWRGGYETGEIEAPVYADVPTALKSWHAAGLALYVYSSGSVVAQCLLFRHTPYGDLTPLFTGYFDTKLGSKLISGSYLSVAAQIGAAPSQVLFLSDSDRELDAASEAGLRTIRLDRDGGAVSAHPIRRSFTEIQLNEAV